MLVSESEPEKIKSFKSWFTEHGGRYHPSVRFVEGIWPSLVDHDELVPWAATYFEIVSSGFSIVTGEQLYSGTRIVTCPLTLAITEKVAQRALCSLIDPTSPSVMKDWSARQWICSYMCLHLIVEETRPPNSLAHFAYLKTLPASEKLRTSLHFTSSELEMFRGTNLYSATTDREHGWRTEWNQCRAVIAGSNAEWANKFTWELFLTAATHLSSRAFPDTLLSPAPSLISSSSAKPVLLPGIDSLNHARAQPVSWVLSYPDENSIEAVTNEPNISLVLHISAVAGQELFNNYGAKPNSELILGYGFSLPHNPDDTILLKIGGIEGKKWEVGRSARGVTGLWDEVLRSFNQDSESAPTYEDYLDAAGALADMVQALLDRLPTVKESEQNVEVRPEVASMLDNYVEGQRNILESLIGFAHEKEQFAIEIARAEGIEIVVEDE